MLETRRGFTAGTSREAYLAPRELSYAVTATASQYVNSTPTLRVCIQVSVRLRLKVGRVGKVTGSAGGNKLGLSTRSSWSAARAMRFNQSTEYPMVTRTLLAACQPRLAPISGTSVHSCE